MLMNALSDFCCYKCGGTIRVGERISRVVPGHQYHPQCSPKSEDVIAARLEMVNENEAALKVAAMTEKRKTSSQFLALITVTLIAEIILIGAMTFRNSYGYYILLRLIVCPLCVFFTIRLYRSNREIFAVFLGFLAVIYNPILSIRFPHGTWKLIDGATFMMIAVAIYLLRSKGITNAYPLSVDNKTNS
jgi:hypothetical protein